MGVYVRLLAAFAALVGAAAAVVVVALLVHGLPALSPDVSAAPAAAGSAEKPAPKGGSTSTGGFPAPPSGALVYGRQAGVDALGLAVKPGPRELELQASLVRRDSTPAPHLSVSFRVSGANGEHAVAVATPCGSGCYRATAAVAKPERVTVVLTGHKPSRVSFALPAAWPPPSGAAIVARAARTWLGLSSLVVHDRLGDGNAVLKTVWRIVAPDRLAYSIDDGEQSIIIGDRRWIKPAGSKRWITTPQLPIQQPQPFWASAVNARILGSVSVNGKPAWEVSFFDPKTPGWFTIVVDKATMHTMSMSMTATAHFMHDTYSRFNAPLEVVPPPSG